MIGGYFLKSVKALLREIVLRAFIGIPMSRMKIRIWPRKFLHQ